MVAAADLANKYRPRTFKDVVGQDRIVASLRQVIERKSARAFAMTGPSGVGKTTLARIIAKALGCVRQNIVEIDGASNTGAEHWRLVTQGLFYLPFTESKVRVIIVDEAHAISKAAWQSLLKHIEEPPEGVYWIFCTTEGGKIPPTILTRCARYDLSPVRADDLLDLLTRVCEAEGGGPGPKVLGYISRNSGGSPRQALTALAACWAAKSLEDCERLMKTAGEDGQVIDLLRGLVSGSLSYQAACQVLQGMADTNAESLRLQTQAYLTKVALGMGAKGSKGAERAAYMLGFFHKPYMTAGNCVGPYLSDIADCLGVFDSE